MNDATKRISRKSSSQSTSLRAGTSGQAVKQAIEESMSGSSEALNDGERRALFSSISQHRSMTESDKDKVGGVFDD